MEAIILAGGRGTRLQPVFPDTPKVLVPVAGIPFIRHLLDYWIVNQRISRFILAVGHKAEEVQKTLGNSYRQAPLIYSVEDKPLGTGGALLKACSYLKGNLSMSVLVLNGDTLFRVNAARMLALRWGQKTAWKGCIVATDPSGKPGGAYLIQPVDIPKPKLKLHGRILSLENDLILKMSPINLEFNETIYDIGTKEGWTQTNKYLGGTTCVAQS